MESLSLIERELFFYRLIGGGYYTSGQALLENARRFGISFRGDCFAVATVRLEQWGNIYLSKDCDDEMEAVSRNLSTLRAVFEAAFGFTTAASEFNGNLVCVINFDSGDSGAAIKIKKKAYEAIALLEDNHSVTVSVSISRTYKDITQLSSAYDDTLKVIDYNLLIGEDFQVSAYDDLSYQNFAQSANRFLHVESKLLSCLQVSDFDGARQIVHDLISREFHETKPSIQIIRFRIYSIVNCVLNMMEELRSTIGDQLYYEIDPGHRLTNTDTLQLLLEEIDDIFDRLIDFSNEKKKTAPPPWVNLIRNYVNERYCDINLTVSSVSDHFNMSPSYCSRIFKQYVGLGLFEYIQRLRLEAAKNLINSGLSVKKIAERVGFSSSLTMNRAFKRYEGTTPSMFKNG